MEKINITIPSNLTPEEEILAIAKQLGRQLLPPDKKMIGSGYEIRNLHSQINIKREVVEKVTVTQECSVCSTVFERNIGKRLWVNYGGIPKLNRYCSDACRTEVLQIVGSGRAAIRKSGLVPVRCW